MFFLTTELIFGDVNTISIPTDAILIVSLLIVFALIGYSFNNILNNDTNQLAEKIDINSNLKLEDQFKLEAITPNQKHEEKPSIKKLNFLPPSKFWGLSSLAIITMGGASLLGIQNIEKSYEGVNTNRKNVTLDNQSTKLEVSVIDLKPLDKTETNINNIHYFDQFLSSIQSSEYNHNYQIKEKQIENNFSF